MASAVTPLSAKEIRAWRGFSGQDTEWEEWAFATTAALSDLGWADLLTAARNNPEPLDPGTFGPVALQLMRNLYSLLAQSCRGKAQTICRLQTDFDGFEVWRLLWLEYRPRGAEPAHAQLSAIIQPRWWTSPEHRGRPFMDVLLDWEGLVAACELASGEVVSNNTRCATLLGWAPTAIEQLLRSASADVRGDYQSMKACIRDRQIGKRGAAAYAPSAPSTTAMEVDAVTRGDPVKGNAKKCTHCGRDGHDASGCWKLIGYPEGKGAGGAGGASRSPKGNPKGPKGGKGGRAGGSAGSSADKPICK